MDFFATTAKGIEEVLADELTVLGIAVAAVEAGGVRFTGDMNDCYRANLWLRTASRVLMPLAGFPCDTPQALYDGVRAISWYDLITPEMTLAVDCNLRDSAMTHSGFVALKTKDAIVDAIRDRFGSRPDVDTRDPDLRVNVHLVKNRCTVSLDTSGIPLDRRGYRLERNEAPLRETLAAALIMLSGWDGTVPLADPMCGSGTIPIEAALKAACRAPGILRAGFRLQALARVRCRAVAKAFGGSARCGARFTAGAGLGLRPVGRGAENCSAELCPGRCRGNDYPGAEGVE